VTTKLDKTDYAKRNYLSAIEVARHLGISVAHVHSLVKQRKIRYRKSTSGQYRFCLEEIEPIRSSDGITNNQPAEQKIELDVKGTKQRLLCGDSRNMEDLKEGDVHLACTSPPYFNAKMYSQDTKGDLGNINDLDAWFQEIGKAWQEVFRVLQPGRKFFINIMNLPIRESNTFRTLNLAGKTIDLCEEIGFVFKRDIVWQKTNGVRAHFGTFPYPGGILINHMHEFVLEFNKPDKKGNKKYAHVSSQQKEASKLKKDFWLSLKNSDVWVIKPEKSGRNRQHVAPFPIELPYRLIKAYSFVGETILDPFSGSGTVSIAAAMTKRNSIGYEINKDIMKVAIDRLENLAREYDV